MSVYDEKIAEFYNSLNLNDKQESLDEEDKKKKDFLSEIKKYKQEIDEIKSKYVVKLDLKPMEKLTESQLLENANEQVNAVYDKKTDDLQAETNEKIDKINTQSQNVLTKAQEQKNKLENTYEKLGKEAEKNAIKKGVQRSSIVSEKIKDLSKNKIQELLNVDNEVANTLYQNNTQIKKLEEEYKKSISNLETAKAIDVKEKLNDLIKEQDKKILDIISYNNTMRKEEQRLNQELEDAYLLEGKERVDVLQGNLVNEALKYFLSMPKEQALKEIEEPEIKELLGDSTLLVLRYLKNL